MNPFDDEIDIPEIFQSFETGKPLALCGLCGGDLMTAETPYIIEKAFNGNETVFEHAICLNCHAAIREEMSEESRSRLDFYFREQVNFQEREIQCSKQFGQDADKWISHCLIKSYPQAECGEFQIYGFCVGDRMLLNGFPYLISGEVVDEIMDLLSEETLGLISEISEKLFGIDAPKDLLIL